MIKLKDRCHPVLGNPVPFILLVLRQKTHNVNLINLILFRVIITDKTEVISIRLVPIDKGLSIQKCLLQIHFFSSVQLYNFLERNRTDRKNRQKPSKYICWPFFGVYYGLLTRESIPVYLLLKFHFCYVPLTIIFEIQIMEENKRIYRGHLCIDKAAKTTFWVLCL